MVIRNKSVDGLSLSDIRRLKRKRKKTRKKILLGLMLLLMICIGLLFTPVFNLKEIEINGNTKVPSEEIVKSGGFVLGENIFKFKLNVAGENIGSIPYVNSVILQRRLPGKIEITVTECIPVAYIQSADGMVVVDKDGKVLEKKTDKIDYKLPILFDFKYEKYTIGKKINENNNENLQKTLEITKNLYNNNLIDKVLSITTTKGELYLNFRNGLKVIVGNEENINAKLTMLKEVLNQLPEGAGGILDARDPDRIYHRAE